jgi:hypothetical protein
MGFAYRYEEGWAFLEGPSGGLGHRWNAPGFDGVAFRIRGDFELEILDNKSLARLGNVSSASALTTNLRKNLDDLITRANSASLNDVPRIAELRGALRDTRIALDSGGKMPSNVRLVVTNAGGRSTGVTTRLAQQGIEFRSLWRERTNMTIRVLRVHSERRRSQNHGACNRRQTIATASGVIQLPDAHPDQLRSLSLNVPAELIDPILSGDSVL